MKCPLKFPPDVAETSDLNGTMWDTGIPYECWGCVNRALGSTAVRHEYFRPELEKGETEETLELWTACGLRRLDAEAGRCAIQEVGIDSDGTNENGILSRSTIEFACDKT